MINSRYEHQKTYIWSNTVANQSNNWSNTVANDSNKKGGSLVIRSRVWPMLFQIFRTVLWHQFKIFFQNWRVVTESDCLAFWNQMALEISYHIKQAKMEIIQDEVMFWCYFFSAALYVFICVVFYLLDKITGYWRLWWVRTG